ncbi:MAG: LPS-assembly protein LptD, partial [Methylocystis sp.]
MCIIALTPAQAAGTAEDENMVVEAKELINNQDTDTVTASGNVQIFYKGRALEADRVIYNRKTQQIFAEGHAKLTERDGSVVRAERFELTDDFKAGFINSLQYDALNDTQMSAPHAELVGNTRVYDKGTYTACA